jgi:hypothetical protein
MKVKAGQTVDDFIRKLDPEHKAIAIALREVIRKAAPKATEAIKWGSPWWSQNGNLFCIYTASDHINFGFTRGTNLDDPKGLLEGTGKGMRHIKLFTASDIRKTQFTSWIKQAVNLDAE